MEHPKLMISHELKGLLRDHNLGEYIDLFAKRGFRDRWHLVPDDRSIRAVANRVLDEIKASMRAEGAELRAAYLDRLLAHVSPAHAPPRALPRPAPVAANPAPRGPPRPALPAPPAATPSPRREDDAPAPARAATPAPPGRGEAEGPAPKRARPERNARRPKEYVGIEQKGGRWWAETDQEASAFDTKEEAARGYDMLSGTTTNFPSDAVQKAFVAKQTCLVCKTWRCGGPLVICDGPHENDRTKKCGQCCHVSCIRNLDKAAYTAPGYQWRCDNCIDRMADGRSE